jgi:hypothetical protein
MFSNSRKIIWFLIAALTCLSGKDSTIASAQRAKKPFTVADEIGLSAQPDKSGTLRRFTVSDDIGLALFTMYGGGIVPSGGSVIKFSPNGSYFAVVSERGALDQNVIEDTIWLFRTEEVGQYVQHPELSAALSPVPLVRLVTDGDSPVIGKVKWLADSSAIAFTGVKKNVRCKFIQLFLAEIGTGEVRALTPDEQNVDEFDIRSGSNYVYKTSAPKLLQAPPDELEKTVVVTGKGIWKAVFPSESQRKMTPFDEGGLWVVADGKKFRVMDAQTQKPLEVGEEVSLSPDMHSVVTILPVEHHPEFWTRYKIPPDSPLKNFVREGYNGYYLVDLRTGTKRLLINAPTGETRLWNHFDIRDTARWSEDGKLLLFSNVFLPLTVDDPAEVARRESRPSIAVLRLTTGELSSVLLVSGGLEDLKLKRRYAVDDLRFADDRTVVVNFNRMILMCDAPPSAVFQQEADGAWRRLPGAEDPYFAILPFQLEARESINEPPVIAARDRATGASRVVWDPNPQLREINLGEAEVIHGKDATGYEWEVGLVKPPDYVPGKRYPMVIQTHGFAKRQFQSHGTFTGPFASRALAAAGIMVVQVEGNHQNEQDPPSAPNEVTFWESIVNQLANEGLVDPTRVGATGFSATVYYVLFAMSVGKMPLAAASVSDGIDVGYFEYVLGSDTAGLDRQFDQQTGSSPLDHEGMSIWLARSPGFNMDKVKTPLLLVQPGPMSTLADWEPYAMLRHLHKPVDLIMMPEGTHPLSNPGQRLECGTYNVDWFRFWLKGEEDPDPAKAEQYARWRELRKMQSANENKLIKPGSASN